LFLKIFIYGLYKTMIVPAENYCHDVRISIKSIGSSSQAPYLKLQIPKVTV